ncbi:hypothetical protein [Streptomyces sp. NPDC002952]|uniref:hypothetical protein n=1 Tax=Streptomyces sp. NPDC002952 TaxID=3364673 RepID=UPI0036AA1654
MAEIHPATAQLLGNFRYDHLPEPLQAVSKPFYDLAHQLAETLSGPEVTRALGDLWDAKNWAVVAASNSALEEALPPAAVAPEPGDVVLYQLTEHDAADINRQRTDFHQSGSADQKTGFVGHNGNHATEGDVCPAVVVRVFNESTTTCNLQVLLDGTDTYWATSRVEGGDPGQWARRGGV